MKHVTRFAARAAALALMAAAVLPVSAYGNHPIYRMYNPNSGEHFYTAFSNEVYDLQYVGWRYEGTAWTAPESGWYVYRLYNPNAGDHHYTVDEDERNALISYGWVDEGVGWTATDVGWTPVREANGRPVYRLYNPNAVTGSHHFTMSVEEANALLRQGWKYEGVGWFELG